MSPRSSAGSAGDFPPVRIPYGRQSINEADIEAVVASLRSPWVTQGPQIEGFEHDLAEKVGARFAVAMSSGTSALHAACAVGGVSTGDQVAVPSLTFAASANCIRFVGGSPVLVDLDPATLNLDLDRVPSGVKGLVAVHFAGLPVELARLEPRPALIIEDAAHALGAFTPSGPVGSCAESDMCCFSFHPVKAITTGEGGAVTTNDPELASLLRRWRNHSIVRPEVSDDWTYDVAAMSGNARMTDLQAALGRSQLGRLDEFVQRRNELADRYRSLLADLPVEMPPPAPPGTTHAYHLFPIRVENRRDVYQGMRRAGIGVQVHYVPIHHHSTFQGLLDQKEPLTRTDEAYERLLSLPLFPDLTVDEQDVVVVTLRSLLTP